MQKSGPYNSFSGGPPHVGAPSWTTESGGMAMPGMGHMGLSASQPQGMSGTNHGSVSASPTSTPTTPGVRLLECEGTENQQCYNQFSF